MQLSRRPGFRCTAVGLAAAALVAAAWAGAAPPKPVVLAVTASGSIEESWWDTRDMPPGTCADETWGGSGARFTFRSVRTTRIAAVRGRTVGSLVFRPAVIKRLGGHVASGGWGNEARCGPNGSLTVLHADCIGAWYDVRDISVRISLQAAQLRLGSIRPSVGFSAKPACYMSEAIARTNVAPADLPLAAATVDLRSLLNARTRPYTVSAEFDETLPLVGGGGHVRRTVRWAVAFRRVA